MCYNVSHFYNSGGLNVSFALGFCFTTQIKAKHFQKGLYQFTVSRFCMFTGISPIGGCLISGNVQKLN